MREKPFTRPTIVATNKFLAQAVRTVDLHFKLGLGQFLEKRYTSIETFAA